MGFDAGSLKKLTESQPQTASASHKSNKVVEQQLSSIPEQRSSSSLFQN